MRGTGRVVLFKLKFPKFNICGDHNFAQTDLGPRACVCTHATWSIKDTNSYLSPLVQEDILTVPENRTK